MVMLTFSVLDQKYCFWANLVQKNQSCHFKLKFGTFTNLNMQNSMVMLTFSVLNQKYCFLANLVQKIKIITLSSHLVVRLILICRIQW